jgi:ferredoxin-type protein NapG
MAGKLDEPQPRSTFFRNLGLLVGGFVAEKVEDVITGGERQWLRPPGALDELAFLSTCTRCDKCLPACPQAALVKAPASAGLAAGTPYIQPRSMPCFLCQDLPCIPACPDGALVWPVRRIGSEEKSGPAAVKMGTARIHPSRCLTYPAENRPAQDCQVCVEHCPFPGEAIRMTEGTPAHPLVDETRCTGCGLCVFACPTVKPAIEVEPKR